jgi:hypothetical protein
MEVMKLSLSLPISKPQTQERSMAVDRGATSPFFFQSLTLVIIELEKKKGRLRISKMNHRHPMEKGIGVTAQK